MSASKQSAHCACIVILVTMRDKTACRLVNNQHTVLVLSFLSPQPCVVLMHRIPKTRGFARESVCATSPSHILPSWRRKRWQVRRWRWRASGCRARHSTTIRWYSTPEHSRICFSAVAVTSATPPTTRSGRYYHVMMVISAVLFLGTCAERNIWIWRYSKHESYSG